ncbi:YonK family protein [Brevibacillus sp. NRS-1366]|uniref:YonK family protein n=1 Tax=Brevibacillus sp. NRS-1366 TaxID=3233899 RepID=UPI003D224A83
MAKNNSSFAVTGNFEMDTMKIAEEKKDGIKTFDLRKVLRKYDGYKVKFSISIDSDDSEFLVDEQEDEDEQE